MSVVDWLPAAIVLSSLVPGLIIFALPERRHGLRTTLNLAGAALNLLLVVTLVVGVFRDQSFESRFTFVPGMDLVLNADHLSMLFAPLSSGLWFVTTLYAVGYLEHTPDRSRFFGFFSLCVAATLGVALAGNLFTFLVFYELLTLTTFPLVVHRGTAASVQAGAVYLRYTVIGGVLLLIGVAWLAALVGPLEFTATGILAARTDLDRTVLVVIFWLLIGALGVKAALVPLHGWLPRAMVAPAPVSALLHAVAVVKAGAFGIVRVVYDIYGIEFAHDLGVTGPLAVLAAVTIVYGSIRALYQDELKKRLAYSTISQVSYIALGTAVAGPVATIGGVVHLVHQGVMKITLFFCAGNLAETLHIHHISEMRGVGRRMPLTMAAFTIAALGMIGVPPVAGFISKWYLAAGSVQAEQHWVLMVLALSTALNAAYFLPILYTAWFREPAREWPAREQRFEAHWMLLAPALATAILALGVGLFANTPFSPLDWVRLIARREYGG